MPRWFRLGVVLVKGFVTLEEDEEEAPGRLLPLLLMPLLGEETTGGCGGATSAGRSRMPCGLPKMLCCALAVVTTGGGR